MSRIAYVNGRYLPLADAKVHVEDRGYQFGDGVYEVCEVRDGRLIDERRHLERLQRSLSELRIHLPISLRALDIVLRETVRRKLRRTPTTLEIVATTDTVEAGIDAYEEIYARSWKVPEPYPRFHAEMMRRAAAAGVLRLVLLRVEARVIAAQIWIVQGGRAAVLKLAHDESDKTLSPGTVLTALMIRELLGREAVTELDFGRGDDAYKQLWATQRRQRIGIVLANPLRLRGLAALGRQALGHARRRLR